MKLLAVAALMALFAGAGCAQDEFATLGESGMRATSPDGDFEFTMHTALQFRLTYHDVRAQDGQSGQGQNGADFMNFSLPGARTFFEGHFFGREFQYSVWFAWAWPGGSFRIEDCYFRWAPLPLFNVTAGQIRVPATWAYQVDHEHQVMSDRDIADEAFSQSWGKGVEVSGLAGLYEVGGDAALLRWNAGLYNGKLASPDGAQGRGAIVPGASGGSDVLVTDFGRTEHYQGGLRNADFGTDPESFSQLVDAELMGAVRLEFHPLGAVPRHMADIEGSSGTGIWKIMIAVSGSYMTARVSGSNGTFLGNDYFSVLKTGVPAPLPASGRLPVLTQIFNGSVDGHFRWMGLAINWALHLRTTKFTATGSLRDLNLEDDPFAVKSTTDLGASVDVNYFVVEREVNVSARYATVNFDEFGARNGTGQPVDSDSFGTDGSEIGFGITWCIHGDNLKLNCDYRYVTQQLPHGVTHSGTAQSGVRRSSAYYVFQEIRVQLQWIF